MLPFWKETQLGSPHSDGSVTAAGRLWECSEGRCSRSGVSQKGSFNWNLFNYAEERMAAKNFDLVPHALSFTALDFYMINYHF